MLVQLRRENNMIKLMEGILKTMEKLGTMIIVHPIIVVSVLALYVLLLVVQMWR